MTSTRRARRWAFAAATAAILVVAGCRSAPAWMQDGMTPPALEGVTPDGQPVSLASLRGKVVAVIFFADWCPTCRAFYATERELATRSDGRPFALVGVAPDNTAAEIREAIRRERITWPVVHDADQHIANDWGVTLFPTVYLIDAEGVIRSHGPVSSGLLDKADALIAETAGTR